MSRTTGHSDIDRVREATDLVRLVGEHVALKPKGREHVGLCPFHDDHSPSMAVVTHKGNAFYKCFACGATGDAFTFVMEYHKKDFPEALRFLADRAGITLSETTGRSRERSGGPSRGDLRKANEYAATFFRRCLSDETVGGAARDMITQRGISDEMVETFGLGASPDAWDGLAARLAGRTSSLNIAAAAGLLRRRDDGGFYDTFRNRVIFPICDEMGVPIAFGGRVINADDDPKYMNSPESPVFNKSRTLYGFHLARPAIEERGMAIVTEGYTDVIACHQAGVTNVVGTLGTALTTDHAQKLSRFCDVVVLVFDGDEAGQRAADRAVRVFFDAPVDVRICVLPGGVDPDDLLRQDDGLALFQAAIDDSIDALAFKFDRFTESLRGVETSAGRQKRVDEFLNDLVELGFGALQGVRRQDVIARLHEMTRVPLAELDRVVRERHQRTRRTTTPTTTSSPSPEGPVTEMLTADLLSAGVTRAQRLAEHSLLGLLIFDPTLAAITVRETSRLLDILESGHFQDIDARRVAMLVLAALREGETVTVPMLHTQVNDEHLRRIISDLYFEGDRRLRDADEAEITPEAAMAAAFDEFESNRAQARYNERAESARRQLEQSDPDAMDALQELIEQRRQQASMPAAIPQGVRT